MKRPQIQLDETKFYLIGKYAFLIVAVMGLAGLIDNLGNLTGGEILSKLAIVIFNFALMGFFAYLLNKFQKKETTDLDAETLAKEVGDLLGQEVTEIKEGKNVKKIKKK
jgi:hypothetical protein